MSTLGLSERDAEFFSDVYALIQNKYPDLLGKFGIWREHQHFELNDDEIFHETSDCSLKESTLRIIKRQDLPEGAFVSSWKLSGNGPVAMTWCCDDRPVR